jgi:hypothetical protein
MLVLALTASTSTRADVCPVQPTDPGIVAMDSFVWGVWQCNASYVDGWWKQFQMNQGENWEDYGLYSRCNLQLPMARTLNGLFLVNYSSPSYLVGTGRLSQGWSHVRDWTGRLSAGCDDGSSYAYHTQAFWPFVNERTRVYQSFFYNLSPVERAGTLVHEARHHDKLHDADDSSCARGASCDSSWGYDGANRYQVEWLSDWEIGAVYRNTETRQAATNRANSVLKRGFQTTPNLKQVPGVGLKPLCYPNCPPPPTTCGTFGQCGTYPTCYSCDTGCMLKSSSGDAPSAGSAGPGPSQQRVRESGPIMEMLPQC